jgi:hypothetical protein
MSGCQFRGGRNKRVSAAVSKATPRVAATHDVQYLTAIPRDPLPPGRIVIHNHVQPSLRLNNRGFRAWTAKRDGDKYEVCLCEWAKDRLAEHYRVRRADARAAEAELARQAVATHRHTA